MFQRTSITRAVQSHQKRQYRVPQFAAGYGRNWNESFKRYANRGWGLGFYNPQLDRRFRGMTSNRRLSQEEIDDGCQPLSRTTKTLSPHFRPFALEDGGVMFLHPTTKQILTWTHDVLGKEQTASGIGNVHDQSRAKLQALIADNTIEHVSLATWRRTHVQRILRRAQSRN